MPDSMHGSQYAVSRTGVVLLSVSPGAGVLARLRRSAAVGAVSVAVLLAAGWMTGLGTGWVHALVVPESERNYNEVSLYVQPEDAERLALMAHLGTLTLSLRNGDNKSVRARKPSLTAKVALGH